MQFARSVSTKLNRGDFSKEQIGLYYILVEMEQNSDFVRKKSIPAYIHILDIIAEQGPFDTKEENDRFKTAQRNFINKRTNANLVYSKGSSHNIPQDKPDFVISEILTIYRQDLNYN